MPTIVQQVTCLSAVSTFSHLQCFMFHHREETASLRRPRAVSARRRTNNPPIGREVLVGFPDPPSQSVSYSGNPDTRPAALSGLERAAAEKVRLRSVLGLDTAIQQSPSCGGRRRLEDFAQCTATHSVACWLNPPRFDRRGMTISTIETSEPAEPAEPA